MEDEYCDAPGCDRPAAKHGQGKCWTHLKQLQRTGRVTEIAPKLSLRQRALEAGIAMLDADSNTDYESKKRAFLAAIDALAKEKFARTMRKGRAQARARGVKFGRPARVTDEELLTAYERSGRNVSATARALKMAKSSVHQRLESVRQRELSERPDRPRRTRRRRGDPYSDRGFRQL
jgi:DNA invertase Pin-like site-specific DNA recombinase